MLTEISTVFLSPSSFINPFEHLSEEETKRSVQSYLAYLKDDTRLITNPGLKVNSVYLAYLKVDSLTLAYLKVNSLSLTETPCAWLTSG